MSVAGAARGSTDFHFSLFMPSRHSAAVTPKTRDRKPLKRGENYPASSAMDVLSGPGWPGRGGRPGPESMLSGAGGAVHGERRG
jgi:hypothetical protein